MSRLPTLVHVLKLGNKQLAEMVIDDQVAAAVRELTIAMMVANTPHSLSEACAQVGRAVVNRLDALEEKEMKTLPWSRSRAAPARFGP